MSLTKPQIFDALVSSLPEVFLRRLAGDLPRIYKESYAATHSNPLLGEEEAASVNPHFRRGIFETSLRNIAAGAGLKTEVKRNNRRTSAFSVVTAGNFVFTGSYVSTRNSPVRFAQFRQNFSELNELLPQLQFSEFLTQAEAAGPASPVYCVMVHGPRAGDVSVPGFFDFVFPSHDGRGSVADFSLTDVLQSAQKKHSIAPQVDGAVPLFKERKKDGSVDY